MLLFDELFFNIRFFRSRYFQFFEIFSLNILKNQKSQIALNESKLRLACYECGNKMAKRQPLVKTNGILFMKNREEHVLEQFGIFENYENCAEQAFTRSEIVQGMCYIYFCPIFKSKWYFRSISALAKIDRYFNIIFSENTKLSKTFSDFLFLSHFSDNLDTFDTISVVSKWKRDQSDLKF